jgi:hypothetical protein
VTVALTGPAMTAPLDVAGMPVVEPVHTSDNPHADLIVRISEVDSKGRSRNVSDGYTGRPGVPDRASGSNSTRSRTGSRPATGPTANRRRLGSSPGTQPGHRPQPRHQYRDGALPRTIDLVSTRVVLPVEG